ncbi:MAG TPA: carboxypeptidase-like regulatory domain-containing protein [Bryobacteraceae bacterium]
MLKAYAPLRRLIFLSCLVAATALLVWSQGLFATLTGVVTDPSGADVAGAKVTLTDAASGSARTTTTDGQGYYTFASVPVGSYKLSIAASGFQTYNVSDITLGVASGVTSTQAFRSAAPASRSM